MNLQKIKAINPGRYAIRCPEVLEIHEASKAFWFEEISLAYKYGFMRGQNAEKNRDRKARSMKKISKTAKTTVLKLRGE